MKRTRKITEISRTPSKDDTNLRLTGTPIVRSLDHSDNVLPKIKSRMKIIREH